jgi:three-Cys-motif partner protein
MPQPESPLLGSDGLPARETGAWVHEKNYFVERYLTIFSRGVKRKWQGKLAYVDLFSGPGLNIVRDSREEVEGSPSLALRNDFARYIFVDQPEVLSTLSKRLATHPKFNQISFVEGDCNVVIGSVIDRLPGDHLALAFVDPPGLQIHFETIERLVHRRKIDLLMTIQLGMGITMNLPFYAQPGGGAVLTGFVGNDSWREDTAAGGSASQVSRRILARYDQQLRSLGYETVRDREIGIKNDRNLLLYFIKLASRHPLGEKFWREATAILPSGQRFLKLS